MNSEKEAQEREAEELHFKMLDILHKAEASPRVSLLTASLLLAKMVIDTSLSDTSIRNLFDRHILRYREINRSLPQ
jgi:2-oxo-4-hydroxy-4-carboxy--5-ureidoimidazoline (OHCU) decarboxylase